MNTEEEGEANRNTQSAPSGGVPPLPLGVTGIPRPSRIPKRVNRFISTTALGKTHFQNNHINQSINHNNDHNGDDSIEPLSDSHTRNQSTAIPTSPPPMLLSTTTTLQYPEDEEYPEPVPQQQTDADGTTLLEDIHDMHTTLAQFEHTHAFEEYENNQHMQMVEGFTPRSDHGGFFNNAAAVIDEAVSRLQGEHAAYVEVMEETHASEVQRLRQEIEFYKSMSATEELQKEVQAQLANMREEVEREVRQELGGLSQQQVHHSLQQSPPEELQQHMQQELERMVEVVRKEAAEQLQAQTEELRLEIEASVRQEMQTETERKMRMALLQQMRPQVRAELETALRLEIRTSYAAEIRKEVEAAVIADVEKKIAADFKAKHQKLAAETKAQVDDLVQEKLTGARRELEERIRQEVEQQFERKIAKRVDKEVKGVTEKIRKELMAENEKTLRAQMDSIQAQLKNERAEIARLKSVENLRRSKEAATRKEAEEAFKQQVEEFRRHVADEEARLAKQRSLVAYNAERSHNQQQRLQQSQQQTPQQQQSQQPQQVQSPQQYPQQLQHSHHSQQQPQSQQTQLQPPQTPVHPPHHSNLPQPPSPYTAIQNSPPSHPPQQQHTQPQIQQHKQSQIQQHKHADRFTAPLPPGPRSPPNSTTNTNIESPQINSQQRPTTNSTIYLQQQQEQYLPHNNAVINNNPTKSNTTTNNPPNIQTANRTVTTLNGRITPTNNKTSNKIIHTDDETLVSPYSLLLQNSFDFKAIATKLVNDAKAKTHQSTPQAQQPTQQNTPLPSPSHSNNNGSNNFVMTLGDFEEERKAQLAFESAPPIIPPAGFIGDRLRALLPRVYQLWDACEIAHVHRLAFSTAVRGMDVDTAERRVAAEITRLRNILPKVENEMKLVARREIVKARLGELENVPNETKLVITEKTTLRNELKRITSMVQPMISAWEKSNGGQPFLYRGFRYLSLMGVGIS